MITPAAAGNPVGFEAMRRRTRTRRLSSVLRRLVLVPLLVATMTALVWLGPGPALTVVSADSGAASTPQTGEPVRYRHPVDAPVVDPFRMENGPYGAGNRGLEYGTTGGEVVVATAPGLVTFAGPVAGRLAITLAHADGRLSSVTNVVVVSVLVGQVVLGGQRIGLAGPGLHLGIREDGVYIDPAPLLSRVNRGGHTYLVVPRVLVPMTPLGLTRSGG